MRIPLRFLVIHNSIVMDSLFLTLTTGQKGENMECF